MEENKVDTVKVLQRLLRFSVQNTVTKKRKRGNMGNCYT